MYKIQLLPQQQAFYAEGQQTVLDAAFNAEVAFPHRCQVGACGACLCRMVKGEVRYTLPPLLTEQEQAEGWIFSCLAIPQSDLILALD
ncbi:2Fe-2S iron-sulfur cluster-binding protein [Thaumasiovibrio sp. DFM-14]|uniref:2Fe-2S iron-sulfur cluster-binding protein n=1 Tax=Thaumasiovibrio sp. DFM-14 TaxID=3384792 RepID=UPI0039A135B7